MSTFQRQRMCAGLAGGKLNQPIAPCTYVMPSALSFYIALHIYVCAMHALLASAMVPQLPPSCARSPPMQGSTCSPPHSTQAIFGYTPHPSVPCKWAIN